MNIEKEDKKDILYQVLLDQECSDFVLQTCKDLNISKSQAIRSMVRVCKNANFADGGQ
jgi:hypothetical protein